jgi:hypothetical protein
MAQDFTDDCFGTSHVGQTDLTNMENNFACLKSSFSGTSAPSNPVAGMLWYDTTNNILKLRNAGNSAWIEIYDFGNDRVPSGKVKTASLQNGALSADTTGRAKMAANYITSDKVNDLSGTKITDNTISTAKIQNKAISPSKLGAGVSNPIVFVPTSTTITAGSPPYIDVQGLTQSYQTVWQCYLYIPDGVKYVILAGRIRGGSGSQTVYLRLNVNGTTGAVVSAVGLSFANVSSSALDISGQAGAMRSVTIEAYSASSATTMLSIAFLVVQFYGA